MREGAISVDFLKHFADESREVLSTILAQSRDCIKLFSVTGELEYINPNGLMALAIEDSHHLVGLHWTMMWPPENRAQIENALERAARGEATRFEAERAVDGAEPRWWDVSVSPVRSSEGAITHILAISRNVTDLVTTRSDDRLRREVAEHVADFERSVSREMRHRLKNQLAVVGAVAKLLARHTETARDLSEKLGDRLQALARAQDLLAVRREQPVQASEAIRQVLDAGVAEDRIDLGAVPEAALAHEAVQTLALVLGELQTNALKHGALKADDGAVRLTVNEEADGLVLHWEEDCGREIQPLGEDHGGFQLIRRLGHNGKHAPEIASGERGISVVFRLRKATSP